MTGASSPWELAITPIRLGEEIAFSAFVRDITERKRSEERQRAQLERMHLLDHVTRAISERQDLQSIFQVVIGSLEEHLPIDFGCIYECYFRAFRDGALARYPNTLFSLDPAVLRLPQFPLVAAQKPAH